jgi:hypothetical protein
VADIIGLAAVQATWKCTGRVVSFQTGRKDATGPNEPGHFLPPSTNDPSRIYAVFARSGLDKQDAIALTLGGHTIGYLHIKSKLSLYSFNTVLLRGVVDPIQGLKMGRFDATSQFDGDIVRVLKSGKEEPNIVILPSDMSFLKDPEAVALMDK